MTRPHWLAAPRLALPLALPSFGWRLVDTGARADDRIRLYGARQPGAGRGQRRGRLQHGVPDGATTGAGVRGTPGTSGIRLLLGRRLLGLDRLRLVVERRTLGPLPTRLRLRRAEVRPRRRPLRPLPRVLERQLRTSRLLLQLEHARDAAGRWLAGGAAARRGWHARGTAADRAVGLARNAAAPDRRWTRLARNRGAARGQRAATFGLAWNHAAASGHGARWPGDRSDSRWRLARGPAEHRRLRTRLSRYRLAPRLPLPRWRGARRFTGRSRRPRLAGRGAEHRRLDAAAEDSQLVRRGAEHRRLARRRRGRPLAGIRSRRRRARPRREHRRDSRATAPANRPVEALRPAWAAARRRCRRHRWSRQPHGQRLPDHPAAPCGRCRAHGWRGLLPRHRCSGPRPPLAGAGAAAVERSAPRQAQVIGG